MKKLLVAAAATLMIFSGVTGASADRPSVSDRPYEMMQAFAPLVGRWSMVTEMTNDGGQTWQKTPPQMVEIAYRHKELMLSEIPASTDGPGFHMESYITYDQYRGTYRKAAVDDVWGIMDIYEGGEHEGNIVFTNMKSGTFFPIAENVWRGFRLTVELKRPVRTMLIEKTDDDGESWQPAFRVTYTLVE